MKNSMVSLSKEKGDFIYLVSNKDFDDVRKYFSLSETKITAVEPQEMEVTQEPVKKAKQQTLESFFKRSR